ncbi:hypothetical protein EPICR_30334 [Candidatus Desulfarcum epimagneticum]|uniref:Uncharacterized protein n=1 Tax=uncultured Desulfobacteraceae bacterium TaxID=218296 RepID=A0A484HI27_9BACT|nr:hypothetical protein EPICR_30334 [uncultured Desulfobacteraceae bacterium]
MLASAGFQDISITKKENSEKIIRGWNVAPGAEDVVFSAYIKALKPLF